MNTLLSFAVTLNALFTTCSHGINQESPSVRREQVNFDFAWRFHLGDLTSTGTWLNGALHEQKTVAQDSRDCHSACRRDVACERWHFSHKNNCWIWTKDPRRKVSEEPSTLAMHDGPASRDYDDSSWILVDAPHDGLIAGKYTSDAKGKNAYLPTSVMWYRKHFNLPNDWKERSVWVYFEGVFRASTIYLNGQQLLYHDSGYTSFSVRLDNASAVFFGEGKDKENVIAVKADSRDGSGWWYEGAGIYRHTHLVSASRIHLETDGVYAYIDVIGKITRNDSGSHFPLALIVDIAVLHIRADVINENVYSENVTLRFTLSDEHGSVVTVIDTFSTVVKSGHPVTLKKDATIYDIELWSINRPYLYTLRTQVISGSLVVDAEDITLGARRTHWDADTGFYLNDYHYTWRGFNNHNDFTGVGVAVPDRINLFRGQSARAVGGNAWRMLHPPTPGMLDILDRIGIIVWDENRQFGDSNTWLANQRDVVRRDRNHPGIVTWSMCSGDGCEVDEHQLTIAGLFHDEIIWQDPYRSISANQNSDYGGGMTYWLAVQGFANSDGSVFDDFHSEGNLPVIGSECCSCSSQRGEDFVRKPRENYTNFNAICSKEKTEIELNRKFVSGCMVSTLFDYYGDPGPSGWPMVSSSFGSIDLAGFAKASAYWYRAWWLFSAMKNISDSGADVPLNPPSLINPDASPSEENFASGYMIHIVEHWEPHENATTRTIHAYTNAPMAELFVNGNSQGVQQLEWQGWAEWRVTFSAGNLTATALSTQKVVMASHTVLTAGPAAKIVAHIDVPSMETHTGSALVLDGQDAGMVSAAIVDANGRVVPSASHNVTFRVVSGPGRIIGVGNGDPSCHEPNQASWRSAYHGLARAIIQVTVDSASPPEHRRRLLQVDSEGGVRTHIVPPESSIATENIIVEASAPGLGTSTVTIPATDDAGNHGVLAVAERNQ